MKQRITNINTLSALFDRLITENIKLYFFTKDKLTDNITHQENVIVALKTEISELFNEIYNTNSYEYIGEKRTYSIDDVTETLETLIQSDILTGEGDRDSLTEAKTDNPNIQKFVHNHKKIRKANETRALSKNTIDAQLKKIIGDK